MHEIAVQLHWIAEGIFFLGNVILWAAIIRAAFND